MGELETEIIDWWGWISSGFWSFKFTVCIRLLYCHLCCDVDTCICLLLWWTQNCKVCIINFTLSWQILDHVRLIGYLCSKVHTLHKIHLNTLICLFVFVFGFFLISIHWNTTVFQYVTNFETYYNVELTFGMKWDLTLYFLNYSLFTPYTNYIWWGIAIFMKLMFWVFGLGWFWLSIYYWWGWGNRYTIWYLNLFG